MLDGLGFSCRKGFSHKDIDNISVFRMDHREQVILPANAHHFENVAVIEPQASIVGCEDLDACNAHTRQIRQFLCHLVVEMGYVHVEAVVNAGFWVCHGTVPGDIFREADRFLGDEVYHGGCAAKGGGFSAGVMVISRNGAHHWQLKVHMGVHSAREHEKPGCVNESSLRVLDMIVNSADGFTFHQDVGFAGCFGCDKRTVFDECFHYDLIFLLKQCRSA